MGFLVDMVNWLIGKDLPNWVCLLLSAIIIPFLIYWWKKREVKNIPNLQMSLSFGKMGMNNQQYPSINIKFLNNSDSTIFLSGVRILKISRLFQVSPDAERNIVDNSYILRFPDSKGIFCERNVMLETGVSASTCLALVETIEELSEYSPRFFCKLFCWRKYFRLKYSAMVGERQYKVSFNH